jgi:hypothetical protein
VEASSDSKLRIGGYTYHQRFIGERHMSRILEIISGFLDGGEGVEKVWVGFRVALIFIGIFWDFSGKRKRLTLISRVRFWVHLRFLSCRALCCGPAA